MPLGMLSIPEHSPGDDSEMRYIKWSNWTPTMCIVASLRKPGVERARVPVT